MGESKGEEEAFMSWQYAPGPGVPSRASLVVLEHGLVYEAMRAVLSSAHGEGLRPGLCGLVAGEIWPERRGGGLRGGGLRPAPPQLSDDSSLGAGESSGRQPRDAEVDAE